MQFYVKIKPQHRVTELRDIFRRTIHNKPDIFPEGSYVFPVHRRLIEKDSEESLTFGLVAHRRLFGEFYRGLFLDYFDTMPRNSGVLIGLFETTTKFAPDAIRPGDIDMIVVPYHGKDLILERTIALEIKVVRATYAKPGKSPNEFGFSQAMSLLKLGFPHVAVAHLIVADDSPKEAWREMMSAVILDQQGNLGEFRPQLVDTLPMELIDRAFGRLQSTTPSPLIGFVAAYVKGAYRSNQAQGSSIWTAKHRPADYNPDTNTKLLTALGDYIEEAPDRWFNTPRFAPSTALPSK